MKRWIIFCIVLVFSTYAAADTIIFKDGRELKATSSSVEGEKVKCTIKGGSISFPKEEILRVEREALAEKDYSNTKENRKSESGTQNPSHQKLEQPRLKEKDLAKIAYELEKAKSFIGKHVWAKRFIRNPDIYDEKNIIAIEKLERLQVVDVLENPDSKIDCNEFYSSKEKRRVRVCHKNQPLRIHVKKDDNSTIYLNFSTVDSGYQYECLGCEYLIFEDPYQQHPDWSEMAWNAIKNRKIFTGMDVNMLLMSWGKPLKINKSVGSWGVDEQWVYSSDNYVYLRNGKVRSFQISN